MTPVTRPNERSLTGVERTVLKAMMDRLIPSVGDLDGAGAMGLAVQVEHMAVRTSRWHSALVRTLDALSLEPAARAAGGFLALDGEARDEAIRTVESALPVAFELCLEAVYAAYYADDTVTERVGWAARPLRSEGFEMDPLDDDAPEQVGTHEPLCRRAE